MSICLCVYLHRGKYYSILFCPAIWLGHSTCTLFFIYHGRILTIESYFLPLFLLLLSETVKDIEISGLVMYLLRFFYFIIIIFHVWDWTLVLIDNTLFQIIVPNPFCSLRIQIKCTVQPCPICSFYYVSLDDNSFICLVSCVSFILGFSLTIYKFWFVPWLV